MALDFSKTKAANKASKRKDYPLLPDPDGTARQLANALCEQEDKYNAADAAKKSLQAQLKALARTFFFQANQGKPDPSTGIEITGDPAPQYTRETLGLKVLNGEITREQALELLAEPTTGNPKQVLCLFKDAYIRYEDLSPIEAIIGKPAVDLYFEQAFELKIKSEKIPVSKTQQVIDKLCEALEEMECLDALEAKPYYVPTAGFIADRHRVFEPAVNTALENLEAGRGLTICAVSSAKGRG